MCQRSAGGGAWGRLGTHRDHSGQLHTCKAVRNVRPAFVCLSKQQAYHPFPCILRDPIVMIDDAEQHQWVNDNLVRRCHMAGKCFHQQA